MFTIPRLIAPSNSDRSGPPDMGHGVATAKPLGDPAVAFTPLAKSSTDAAGLRQQLFNEGAIGPLTDVQVSYERIVGVRGILFDLDPKLIREGQIFPTVSQDPHEFYLAVTRPLLDRHPVLSRAEVRVSGTGLHAIIWFDAPVELNNEGDRKRWTGMIKVIQCALPIDPDQPHITAVTRALNSFNAKNGALVTQLHAGEPVPVAEVEQLYQEMARTPFRTLLKILSGSERLQPCPICRKAGTTLSAMDFAGRCYGSCGTVKLDRLYDAVLVPRETEAAQG